MAEVVAVRIVPTLVTTGVVIAVCAGCSTGTSQDNLQGAPGLAAATPAVSPPASSPAGTTLPAAAGVTWSSVAVSGMVLDNTTRTLAVAVTKPAALWLYSLDNPTTPPRVVGLPGPAATLSLARAGGPVLAPVTTANQVVQVALPAGTTSVVPVAGGPTSAAQLNGQLLVAVPGRKTVDVLSGNTVVHSITGDNAPDQVLTVDGKTAVLDRPNSAL